jgi:hypothetical protein
MAFRSVAEGGNARKHSGTNECNDDGRMTTEEPVSNRPSRSEILAWSPTTTTLRESGIINEPWTNAALQRYAQEVETSVAW